MELTPEEQARLDELNEKEETLGASEMESHETAQLFCLLSKQGYEAKKEQ